LQVFLRHVPLIGTIYLFVPLTRTAYQFRFNRTSPDSKITGIQVLRSLGLIFAAALHSAACPVDTSGRPADDAVVHTAAERLGAVDCRGAAGIRLDRAESGVLRAESYRLRREGGGYSVAAGEGFSLPTHLNVVPHLAAIDDELKKSYPLDYFPQKESYRHTYELLKSPSDATIAAVLAHKQATVDAAEASVREARGSPELERGFTTARNAAVLSKDIAAAYFRLLRVEQGLEDCTKLTTAVRTELDDACGMEKQSGQVWPMYPAARGITAYDWAREVIERGKRCCINVSSCQ
jgi:hypothetical protein